MSTQDSLTDYLAEPYNHGELEETGEEICQVTSQSRAS